MRLDTSTSYITIVQDFLLLLSKDPESIIPRPKMRLTFLYTLVRNRIMGKESISQLKVLLHIQRVRGSIIDDVLKIVFVMGYHPHQ